MFRELKGLTRGKDFVRAGGGSDLQRGKVLIGQELEFFSEKQKSLEACV